jgi:hypothetical protein
MTGSKGKKQIRNKIEVFQEFYIEEKDAIEELVNLFAINSDTFEYKNFMKEEKEKESKK